MSIYRNKKEELEAELNKLKQQIAKENEEETLKNQILEAKIQYIKTKLPRLIPREIKAGAHIVSRIIQNPELQGDIRKTTKFLRSNKRRRSAHRAIREAGGLAYKRLD